MLHDCAGKYMNSFWFVSLCQAPYEFRQSLAQHSLGIIGIKSFLESRLRRAHCAVWSLWIQSCLTTHSCDEHTVQSGRFWLQPLTAVTSTLCSLVAVGFRSLATTHGRNESTLCPWSINVPRDPSQHHGARDGAWSQVVPETQQPQQVDQLDQG